MWFSFVPSNCANRQAQIPCGGQRPRRTILVGVCLALWVVTATGQVVINEIHYEPGDEQGATEFIELHNYSATPADLGGWFLSDGIFYQFQPGTSIRPGGFLVVAQSPAELLTRHNLAAMGPFSGRLSNEGERVVLRDPTGNAFDEVTYGVGFPWPTASSGDGASIELIHPSLDNDLGGSWRASGAAANPQGLPDEPIHLVPPRAALWIYRKGFTEPSSPPDAWRKRAFQPDKEWLIGQTSIGFGQDDDLTVLDDFREQYTSLYLRKLFTVAAPTTLPTLRLRLYATDGCVIWLNNVELARRGVRSGEFAHSDLSGGATRAASWEEIQLPGPVSKYLVAGTNTLAVQALKASTNGTGFSFDLALVVPGAIGRVPTPGARNSAYSTAAPPQIRQVKHAPQTPRSDDPIVFSAKVTDPQGVQAVTLRYQVVAPGTHLPARLPVPTADLIEAPDTPQPPNPSFEDPRNWQSVALLDNGLGDDEQRGDGIYTAAIRGFPNRTLVRYRLEATDRSAIPASIRVPYADDPSLNFALFVYDGVPAFKPTGQTVHPKGLGHEYSREIMTSVPVYHVLVREADIMQAHAYREEDQLPQWAAWPFEYHAAFGVFNWECTLVYDGEVYDHVRFRLRQANSRYLHPGKRSLRFRFNPGHRFKARDADGSLYPVPWRSLNLGKLFNNMAEGDFGLTESMNSQLWSLMGVPAPKTHHVHLRVVDRAEAAPATPQGQFEGDFWGMYLAMEDLDPAFLDARELPDGNLYKLKAYMLDGTQLERHQGTEAPAGDADFQNAWRNIPAPRPEEWVRQHVNLDLWYRYFAVAEAVRHNDFGPAPSHMKNQAWFFEPSADTPYGRLWVLPWDSDVSWGPTWQNAAVDEVKLAVFNTNGIGHPTLKTEFRNAVREFRDLVWQPEVIMPMLNRLTNQIAELSRADRDRWRGAVNGNDFGPLERKYADMLSFAFQGWNRTNGIPIPTGGRAAYLDALAGEDDESSEIPATPEISYLGLSSFPLDQLDFNADVFRDPQGDNTFGAIRWRVAEVTDPRASTFDPIAQLRLEYPPVWESNDLGPDAFEYRVPGQLLRTGHAYRVRARVRDLDGHWSHWSTPVHFVAGLPRGPSPAAAALRVVEIMYHAPAGDAFDYLELANLSSETLDLSSVEVQGGVTFSFRDSPQTTLEPGGRLVLVEDEACFRQRYPDPGIRIAGRYRGTLSDKGERIELVDAWTDVFHACEYQDSWFPSTDGAGYSLVQVNPATRESNSAARNAWRPSDLWRGSPGYPSQPVDADRDSLPDEWELAQGLSPLSGSDAIADHDQDGLSASEEFLAGTDPRDAASRLELSVSGSKTGFRIAFTTRKTEPAVFYPGVRFYQVERRVGLSGPWQVPYPPTEALGNQVEFEDVPGTEKVPVFYRLKAWISPD